MAYEHKPGTGTIFKVDDKKSENYPDYKGKVVLQDGTKQDIALWVKDTERGKYFSAKISDPYIAPEKKEEEKKEEELAEDDLPF